MALTTSTEASVGVKVCGPLEFSQLARGQAGTQVLTCFRHEHTEARGLAKVGAGCPGEGPGTDGHPSSAPRALAVPGLAPAHLQSTGGHSVTGSDPGVGREKARVCPSRCQSPAQFGGQPNVLLFCSDF